MRHDPIDPARASGPERPPVATTESSLAAFRPRLDVLERQAVATITASEEELRTLERGASGGPQDDTARALATAVLADVATRERKALEEIAAARARLADGTFGMCEACGGMIPFARLEALPTARSCLVCQAKAERREPGVAA